jgi:ABC-type enterochelin transport system substrate-binding protein
MKLRELKMKTFLKEYSGGTMSFSSIQFQVLVHIDGQHCKIQYIPKTSNELVKLNNVYGRDKVAKKIKDHLEKTIGANFSESKEGAGLVFITMTGNIEDHIISIIS